MRATCLLALCTLLASAAVPAQRSRLILRGPRDVALELPTLPGRGLTVAGGQHWCVLAKKGKDGSLEPLLRRARDPREGWREFFELPAEGRNFGLAGDDKTLHIVWESGEGAARRIAYRAFDPDERVWRGEAVDVVAGEKAPRLGDVAAVAGGVAVGVIDTIGAALLFGRGGAGGWSRIDVAGKVPAASIAVAARETTLHVAVCTGEAPPRLLYGQVEGRGGTFVLAPEPVPAAAKLRIVPGLPCQMALDGIGVPTVLAAVEGDKGRELVALSLWGTKPDKSAVFKAMGRSWDAQAVRGAAAGGVGEQGLASGEGVAIVQLAGDGQRVVVRWVDRGRVGAPVEALGGGGEGRFATARVARSTRGAPIAVVSSRSASRGRVDAVFAGRPEAGAGRGIGYPSIERRDGGRRKLKRGKHKSRARAIERGIAWLVRHQDPDGRWNADDFHRLDKTGEPCTGPGNPLNDVGVTGLALLALIGDGNTKTVGHCAEHVKSAVRWLCSRQDEKGYFVDIQGGFSHNQSIYGHAMVTLALCEMCIEERDALHRDGALFAAAQAGLDYLEAARNPYAVWRYRMRKNNNDSSVTSWCAQALAAGKTAGLRVNDQAFSLIGTWFDQVTDPETGAVGYDKKGGGSAREPGDHMARFPPERSIGLTAAGILVRVLIGESPRESPVIKQAADTILKRPPAWDLDSGAIDLYSWFYATAALHQVGGRHLKDWDKHLTKALVKTQRDDGNFEGSWDPVGAWGHQGGRVYSTAMGVLILESSYRLQRRIE